MKKHTSLEKYKKIYFIGIGGVSMSGLAEILFKDGFEISGSDKTDSTATRHLQEVGIRINIGAAAENITPDIDLVVYTAAIKPDNPERVAAEGYGIPIIVRAQLLGHILEGYEHAVCIAGTHGKTSTTALVTAITKAAGLDPTVNIGGYIGDANYFVGSSSYFILEACEYSNSFFHWHPYIGVILNIDADHLDFYGSIDEIIDAFARFARNIRPNGTLIINESVPGFDRIVDGLACKVVRFKTEVKSILCMDENPLGIASSGMSTPNKVTSGDAPLVYWVRDASLDSSRAATNKANDTQAITSLAGTQSAVTQSAASSVGSQSFDVMGGTAFLARVNLPLPGDYNMYNALAAFAVAEELGIPPHETAKALSTTQGVKKRYEYKGEVDGVTIIDDYAHHPTEIKACLAAARQTHKGRIICLFQPHTYTRTRNHFDDFTQAFDEADITLFVPIYAAREPFDPTISSKMLAEQVGGMSINCNSFEEAEDWLRGKLQPGDLLITMGAGIVHIVGERLLAK